MCLSVRQVFQLWYFYICFSRWPCVFFQHNNLKLQFFFVLSLWLFFCTGTQTRSLLHTNTSFFYIFQINLFVWNCKSNLWFPEGCLTIKPCVQNVTNSLILYSYAQKEELERLHRALSLTSNNIYAPFCNEAQFLIRWTNRTEITTRALGKPSTFH